MPDTGPLGRPPRDYDQYHIRESSPHQPIRGDDPRNRTSSEREKSSLIGAYLRLWFQKIASLLIKRFQNNDSEQLEENLYSDLIALKDHLETLKIEDRSEESSFFLALSSVAQHIESALLPFSKSHFLASEIRLFFQAFKDYPNSEEPSLGSYLFRPPTDPLSPLYTSILQHLFKNHQKTLENSILTKWTSILDRFIASLSHQPAPGDKA